MSIGRLEGQASPIHLRYRVRPYRIAWIVSAADMSTFREVVIRNCGLWGGMFNPIIPLGPSGYSSAETALLLRSFDPDYVGNLTSEPTPAFDANPSWQKLEVQGRSILDAPVERGFMSTLPVIRAKLRKQSRLLVFDDGDLSLLNLALFGALREREELVTRFRSNVLRPAKDYPVGDVIDVHEHVVGVTATGLYPDDGTLSQNDVILFVFNQSDGRALFDLWNIRATGRVIVPLPLNDFRRFAATAEYVAKEAIYKHSSPRMTYVRGTILHGEGVSERDYASELDWLKGLGLHEPGSRWPSSWFGAKRPSGAWTTKVASYDGKALHLVPDPPFSDAEFQGWRSNYVGEVSVRSIGRTMFACPWNINESTLARQLRTVFWSRSTSDGVGLAHQSPAISTSLQGFSPQEGLDAILETHGFSHAVTSTAGLAIDRITSSLGGLEACDFFRDDCVREVLRRLEGGVESLRADEILAVLNRSSRRDIFPTNSENDGRVSPVGQMSMDTLVKHRILRPGMVFVCAMCKREGWYHISHFHERFVCQWCFVDQVTPRLDNMRWRYRTDGLYKLSGGIQGGVATILAMLFLARCAEGSMGERSFVMPAFTTHTSSMQEYEADFAVLAMSFTRGVTVFGEAKSGNRFQQRDVDRMAELARRANAYIAFCTLAEDYSDDEVGLFRSLRSTGAKMIFLRRAHLECSYFRVVNYLKMVQLSRYDSIEGLSLATMAGVLDGTYEPTP